MPSSQPTSSAVPTYPVPTNPYLPPAVPAGGALQVLVVPIAVSRAVTQCFNIRVLTIGPMIVAQRNVNRSRRRGAVRRSGIGRASGVP